MASSELMIEEGYFGTEIFACPCSNAFVRLTRSSIYLPPLRIPRKKADDAAAPKSK